MMINLEIASTFQGEHAMTPRIRAIVRWIKSKTRMAQKYTFSDLKPRLQQALGPKIARIIQDEGSVSLLDGFMTQSLQPEMGET